MKIRVIIEADLSGRCGHDRIERYVTHLANRAQLYADPERMMTVNSTTVVYERIETT